jgi:hypothetical protein
MPRAREFYGAAPPVTYVPKPDTDPVVEAKSYVLYEWFQPLMAVRTCCYRCHAQSPIIYVPYGGAVAFGDPRMLRHPAGGGRKKLDITKDAVLGFARLGWKFQLRAAYCPQCKGLGSVP